MALNNSDELRCPSDLQETSGGGQHCDSEPTLEENSIWTQHSGCKKVNSRFKSPVQVSSTLNKGVCIEEKIREQQSTLSQLESEITLLESEGVCVHELEHHINLLHEYNDIKDIAQTLLGRLASLRSVTVRDLYAQFGMELDD